MNAVDREHRRVDPCSRCGSTVQVAAGFGLTEALIAHLIGVSPDTFYRRKKDGQTSC
jgi:hypothetical protein